MMIMMMMMVVMIMMMMMMFNAMMSGCFAPGIQRIHAVSSLKPFCNRQDSAKLDEKFILRRVGRGLHVLKSKLFHIIIDCYYFKQMMRGLPTEHQKD